MKHISFVGIITYVLMSGITDHPTPANNVSRIYFRRLERAVQHQLTKQLQALLLTQGVVFVIMKPSFWG
jgi:hypothetical protein